MKSSALGWAVSIFFAALPFVTLPALMYPDTNAKYFYLLLGIDVLALIYAYALLKGKRTLKIGKRWFLIAIGIALIAQYASAFFGVFPERSFWSDIFWSSGVFFITHIAFLAFILGEYFSNRDWSLLRRSIVVSAALFSFITILGKFGLGFSGNFLWMSLSDGNLSIGNETYAGMYLVLAFFIGLSEIVRKNEKSHSKKLTAVSLVVIAFSPLLLNIGLLLGKDEFTSPLSILGNARSSSAALIAGLIFVGGALLIKRYIKTKQTLALSVWGGGLILGVVTGVALLFTPGSFVQERYIAESSAARIIVWDMAGAAIADRPVLGWGQENFGAAVQKYTSNDLFKEENFAEIWFERAHNVVLDVLVTTGGVGLIANILLILAFLYVVSRAHLGGRIEGAEAIVLYAIIPVHLIELQTGFDTVSTYALLAVIGGYVLSLERMEKKSLPANLQKALGLMLLVLSLLSIKFLVLDEFDRQSALANTFSVRGANEQSAAIERSLERTSSFETLRLSALSFTKGAFATLSQTSDQQTRERLLSFAHKYENHFNILLQEQPDHYRARMSYAYLLLLQTILGENRTADARQVLIDSYELSPGNPLTYVLQAATELYSNNRPEAQRLIQEAETLAPDTSFTAGSAAYFERQLSAYPNIDPLILENL